MPASEWKFTYTCNERSLQSAQPIRILSYPKRKLFILNSSSEVRGGGFYCDSS